MTWRKQQFSTYQPCVAWCLIIVFLMQPILIYLVTPMVKAGPKGIHTMVCTLEGVKEAYIELPPIAPEAEATEECPALKLYQIATTVQISAPRVDPVLTLYSIGVLHQTIFIPHRALHFSAYSSRAPPFLSV